MADRRHSGARDRRYWVAAGSFAAAAAFLVSGLLGLGDVSPMPALPWPVVAPAGVVAGILVLLRPPARYLRLALAGEVVAGALLLAGSLGRLPHNLLFAIVYTFMQITGATAPFPMVPQWGKFAVHLLTLGAAVLLVWHVHGRVRAEPELLPARWREASMSRARALRWSRICGVVAVVAAVPYGALKIAWSLGWRGGFTDEAAFTGVGVETPGFGDTGLLTVVAIALAILMAVPLRARWPRRGLLAIGVVGTLMLVPAGAIGTYDLVLAAFGVDKHGLSSIALWVFALVYPTLLAWGVALGAQTWFYRSATRARGG